MSPRVALMLAADLLAGKPWCLRSPGWPKARAAHLKLYPRCAVCDGRKDLEVHHVVPVSWPGGKELELASSNLLTLCGPHHLWHGHLGSWFSRNPDVREDAAAWLAKIQSRPKPPA